MFVTEEDGEQNGNDQGVAGEGKPDALPVEGPISQDKVPVDDDAAEAAAKEGSETVGHHHEKALRAGADFRIALCFHKNGTRNIEEIKGHPVNDAGKDYHP